MATTALTGTDEKETAVGEVEWQIIARLFSDPLTCFLMLFWLQDSPKALSNTKGGETNVLHTDSNPYGWYWLTCSHCNTDLIELLWSLAKQGGGKIISTKKWSKKSQYLLHNRGIS